MKKTPPYILLFFCATLPFWGNLYSFLPQKPLPFFESILIFTKSFTLLAPFFFWSKLELPSSWKYFAKHLDLQNNKARKFVMGGLVGILMGAGIIGSFEFLPQDLQKETLSRIALKTETLHIKQHFWIYAVLLSFAHSLLEEFYWRFFLFTAFKKHLPRFRHSLVALAFSLHHFVVTIFYFDFKLGFLLGWGVFIAGYIWSKLYEKENSLGAVWISHIIADIALMSFGLRALAQS
jgi:membrane protease YdiL (CAAX protease family)